MGSDEKLFFHFNSRRLSKVTYHRLTLRRRTPQPSSLCYLFGWLSHYVGKSTLISNTSAFGHCFYRAHQTIFLINFLFADLTDYRMPRWLANDCDDHVLSATMASAWSINRLTLSQRGAARTAKVINYLLPNTLIRQPLIDLLIPVRCRHHQ